MGITDDFDGRDICTESTLSHKIDPQQKKRIEAIIDAYDRAWNATDNNADNLDRIMTQYCEYILFSKEDIVPVIQSICTTPEESIVQRVSHTGVIEDGCNFYHLFAGSLATIMICQCHANGENDFQLHLPFDLDLTELCSGLVGTKDNPIRIDARVGNYGYMFEECEHVDITIHGNVGNGTGSKCENSTFTVYGDCDSFVFGSTSECSITVYGTAGTGFGMHSSRSCFTYYGTDIGTVPLGGAEYVSFYSPHRNVLKKVYESPGVRIPIFNNRVYLLNKDGSKQRWPK